MAVRAEQTQVASVRGPVFESVIPGRGPSGFSGPVDVVDVQNPEVSLSALHASAAEAFDKSHLPLPVSRMFVRSESVGIPVVAAAAVRAKAVLAFLSASLARSSALPSCSEIAVPSAVFRGAVFDAVGVCKERSGAIGAADFNAALFHGVIITRTREPKYFDIACRRIEDAQRQQRMIP
jgi:hypothetical protein